MPPRLTRTQFLFLWGIGVTLIVLFGWKKIFPGDSLVAQPSVGRKASGDTIQKVLHGIQHQVKDPRLPPVSFLDLLSDSDKHGKQEIEMPQQFDMEQTDTQEMEIDANPMLDDDDDEDDDLLEPSSSSLIDGVDKLGALPLGNVPGTNAVAFEQHVKGDTIHDHATEEDDSPEHGLFNTDVDPPQTLDAALQKTEEVSNDISLLPQAEGNRLNEAAVMNEIYVQGPQAPDTGMFGAWNVGALPHDQSQHPEVDDKPMEVQNTFRIPARRGDEGSHGLGASDTLRLQENKMTDLSHPGETVAVGQGGNEALLKQPEDPRPRTDNEREQQLYPQTVEDNQESKDELDDLPETELAFMRRMEAVQKERHDRIHQICQNKYNLTQLNFQKDRQQILAWKKHFEHAYANDDHHFIIFRVLKVGSFSWRKVMISLYEKGSRTFRDSQQMGDFPIMKYSDETFLSKLEHFRKVLFVREPFARFLSAYRDKYVELRHFPYYKPIGSHIITKYRPNASRTQIASGIPTFEEFTRWVVTEQVPDGDFHWRPVFSSLHPCHISYDYIGKLETSADDARYVFMEVGIDHVETYPSTETHHAFSSSREVLRKFYSQLPPELLPKLVERYREEFELFDYPIPEKFSDVWE